MKRRSFLLITIPASFAMLLAGCANLQQPRHWWGRCSVGGAALDALVGAGPG